MNELIKACRLCTGEKIGIFSPSCAATSWISERTEQAIIFLEQYGYQVVRGVLTGKDAGYRSGSIRERAEELLKSELQNKVLLSGRLRPAAQYIP